jgi:hypothetical protein
MVNSPVAYAQAPPAGSQTEAPKIPNDQLDSLVAPIAHIDPLLARCWQRPPTLWIIQLQQVVENKDLKTKQVDAVKKQDWDPSVQAMARACGQALAENISGRPISVTPSWRNRRRDGRGATHAYEGQGGEPGDHRAAKVKRRW